MNKYALLTSVVCVLSIGIHTTYALPFKLHWHIVDNQGKDVPHLHIQLVNGKENKVVCETKTQDNKGTFNTMCDIASTDVIKNNIQMIIRAEAPVSLVSPIIKNFTNSTITDNSIWIGNVDKAVLPIKIKKLDSYLYEEDLPKVNRGVTVLPAEAPKQEEKKTEYFSFQLSLKGEMVDEALTMFVDGVEIEYKKGVDNVVKLPTFLDSVRYTQKNATIKLRIPVLNIEKTLAVDNGGKVEVDVSNELKEYNTFVDFKLSRSYKIPFELTGTTQRLLVNPQQINHENWEHIAEKICRLSQCPMEISYENGKYLLDRGTASYKLVLQKEEKENGGISSIFTDEKNRYLLYIFGSLILIGLIGLWWLIYFQKKKAKTGE